MPETPPNSKGLLPSLSTTTTAAPVMINYNNKIKCQDFLVETAVKSPFGEDFVNRAEEQWEQRSRHKNDKQKQKHFV